MLIGKTKDNLNNFETEDTQHSGRFTYARMFFNDRVSLNTTYNVSHQEVKTTSGGQGFVSLQVFAFAGLSAIDDIPEDGAVLSDDNRPAGFHSGGLKHSLARKNLAM